MTWTCISSFVEFILPARPRAGNAAPGTRESHRSAAAGILGKSNESIHRCRNRTRGVPRHGLGPSLHGWRAAPDLRARPALRPRAPGDRDRKSTRLNSSHLVISYAVFCLKKKKI